MGSEPLRGTKGAAEEEEEPAGAASDEGPLPSTLRRLSGIRWREDWEEASEQLNPKKERNNKMSD